MFQGIYNNLVILIVIHQEINLFNDQTMFKTLFQHQKNVSIPLFHVAKINNSNTCMPSRNYIYLKNNSFKQCNIICKRFAKVPNNAMMFA